MPPMRLLPARWTIDLGPARVVVSAYLLVTGLLIAQAIVMAGIVIKTLAVISATGEVLSDLMYLARPEVTQTAALQAPLMAYFAAGGAVALSFVVATVLMWVRMRGHWVAATAAALIGGCAWWALAIALLVSPHHPSLAVAAVLIAVTAVVTFGAIAATLQRAPRPIA
jgi:hypothetical protein